MNARIDFDALWEKMSAHFSLGDHSYHGPAHWRKVELNGRRLCRVNGADELVVRLFAVFHDVERHNEGYDPEHGRRAADLALGLHGTDFWVPDASLDLLLEACRFHNDGLTSTDLTIGTCWDADRMDLPRVGIALDPDLMSTLAGKQYAVHGPIALELPGEDD